MQIQSPTLTATAILTPSPTPRVPLDDTGALSLKIGVTFIVLALIGLILAIFMLVRSKIEQSKQDKIIEVGKWFFVAIALVVGAAIVSDGFKERDQDVKELAAFDKHVAIITNTKGLKERWLLAQYFSYVAPKGALRDSWNEYLVQVEKDLDKFAKEVIEEKALIKEREDNPKQFTEEKQIQLTKLQQSIAIAKRALNSEDTATSGEWVILAGSDTTLTDANNKLLKAKKVSPTARIYQSGILFRTIIPGFASRDDAEKLLGKVQKDVASDAYIKPMALFCSSPLDLGDYIKCTDDKK